MVKVSVKRMWGLNGRLPTRTFLPLAGPPRAEPAGVSGDPLATTRGGSYDAIVIGSGFGGCFAALPLLEAGLRVLMLERGDWVERGAHNWGDEGAFVLTPHYSTEGAFALRTPVGSRPQGLTSCVGGSSVFYGGASFRFREVDFAGDPLIVGDSGAAWPLGYGEMEPYYGRAEDLLGVAGEAGRDPTEPSRGGAYPREPSPLAEVSARVARAAAARGLNPFRIPMAIDGAGCRSCTTCDAFACAVSAKNDLAVRLVPMLRAAGMELRPRSVVTRLTARDGAIRSVEVADAGTGERVTFSADRVVLAAGALATPHLLLASGLAAASPAPDAIGRYLMRHCNAMIYGVFRDAPNPGGEHHKQIAIHDYYFGDAAAPAAGKLGNIQQVMAPPVTLIRAMLPRIAHAPASAIVDHLTGLLVIAEDEPRAENRITLNEAKRDPFGLPGASIAHRYTRRDRMARRALARRARQVLRSADALFYLTWNVNTFSHAVGTVRMGDDPRTAPLDRAGRFRGLENLWVADGSTFPTSAGVNPSLTIAANALRIGGEIASAA